MLQQRLPGIRFFSRRRLAPRPMGPISRRMWGKVVLRSANSHKSPVGPL